MFMIMLMLMILMSLVGTKLHCTYGEIPAVVVYFKFTLTYKIFTITYTLFTVLHVIPV